MGLLSLAPHCIEVGIGHAYFDRDSFYADSEKTQHATSRVAAYCDCVVRDQNGCFVDQAADSC